MEPIEVEPLLVGEEYATQVYIAAKARKGIAKECDSPRRLMKKLAEVAKEGFGSYPVGEGCMFKRETRGAFRFGYSSSSLFRVIGFYNGPDNVEFIAIDAFMKPGQKPSPSQWERIEWVARIEQHRHLWKKKTT